MKTKNKTTLKENLAFIFVSSFAIITILLLIPTPLLLMKSCDDKKVLNSNQIKKELFSNQHKQFVCAESIMKHSKSWIVSEENNWSIHSDYFKKDTLLLSIASCEIDTLESE